jgi:hypothetical protein
MSIVKQTVLSIRIQANKSLTVCPTSLQQIPWLDVLPVPEPGYCCLIPELQGPFHLPFHQANQKNF